MDGRHLLILDLDETLIHSVEKPLEREPDFHVADYSVYRRPHLAEFLAAASGWFDLAVWSSASQRYVDAIVDRVFTDRGALRFVWANDRCTRYLDDDTVQHFWLKNLTLVGSTGYEMDRILIVDDSAEKLKDNLTNHILVRPYEGAPGDRELADLIPFLAVLKDAADVRTVEKRNWRYGPPYDGTVRGRA